MNTDIIVDNLTVLANVHANDKLITSETVYSIHTPTAFRSMYRSWYGETRASNVRSIRLLIDAAIRCVSKNVEHLQSCRKNFHTTNMQLHIFTCLRQTERIMAALKQASNGLTNLKHTYYDDVACTSQLQAIIHDVADYIGIMTPILKHLEMSVNFHVHPPSIPEVSHLNTEESVYPQIRHTST